MKEDFFVFEAIPVRVSPEEVLKQLGYPQETCVSSKMRKKVETEIAEMLQLIEPKGAYLKLARTKLEGFDLFAGAEKIVLALATIGSALEQKAKELVAMGQSATGLIVDAVGTIAAEQTADFVERQIRQESARYGWKASRRYAPGYCGWELEAQKEIFDNFPNTLGIVLTASCLMIPEKSLSFVCLLSSNGNFDAIKVGDCKTCEQKVCPYRREEKLELFDLCD
jgi:hypothetical protein